MTTGNENNQTNTGDKSTITFTNGGHSFVAKTERGQEFAEEFRNNPSFQDIQDRIDAYSNYNTTDWSEDELEDLNNFRAVAGLQDSGHDGDALAGTSTAIDELYTGSKYLRNAVQKNTLDRYDTPNYVITLYMLKRSAYTKYRSGSNATGSNSDEARETTEVKKTSKTVFSRPAPEDMVIIAQTGSTDLGIDDLEIQTYNGHNSDIRPLKIDFKIVEPGAVSLLSRLAEAKAFCGYEPSVQILPGLFLELGFAGYEDDNGSGNDRDDGGQQINIPIGSEIGEKTHMFFELGGAKYDMQISPDGSEYNFTTFNQTTVGRNEYMTRGATTIQGANLTELIKTGKHSLETAFKNQYAEFDVENNEDKSYTGADYLPNNSKHEFSIDISNFISNIPSDTGPRLAYGLNDSDFDADGNVIPEEQVNLTKNTISNALLKDYALLETFAKSSDIKTALAVTQEVKDENDNKVDNDGDGVADLEETGVFERTTNINVATGDGETAQAEVILSGKGANVLADTVTIKIPQGTHLKDCLYLILSLSEDFVNKAVHTPEGNRDTILDKGYVRWLNLSQERYYDYDSYDEVVHAYEEKIIIEPILSYNSNPNMLVYKEEYEKTIDPTIEEITARLDSLAIQKEYFYSFTGENDQVLQAEFNFDEAFAIEVPIFGRGSYAEQTASKTRSALKEDEAATNTNDDSGVATSAKASSKASSILDSLQNMSDTDLEGFADYAGFNADEIKQLVQEKNANGTGVRGTGGQRYEDQTGLQALAASLSVDEIGIPLLQGYKTTPGQSGVAPMFEDKDTDATEDTSITSKYVFASELVLGLEGEDSSVFAQADNAVGEAKEHLSKVVKPKLIMVDNEDTTKEVPVESGSLRPTIMSHLMRKSSNAKSHLHLEMAIRGDPYWLGHNAFYNSKGGGADWIKKTHDVLFVMGAPRRFDNDMTDEDNNTGLYDYGYVDQNMSGVYQVLTCTSSFSGGLFQQTLNMFINYNYEMTKIELIKQSQRKFADYWNPSITDEDGNVTPAGTVKAKSEYHEKVDELLKTMERKGQKDAPVGEQSLEVGDIPIIGSF